MAKLLSQIATKLRGSIGGITYLSGPHNAIIARARVNPVNPNTIYQATVRSCFLQAVGAWTALDRTTRTQWDQWAATLTRTNKLGISYTPSGRQEFIRFYAFNRYAEANDILYSATPTVAPSLPGGPETCFIETGILSAPGTGFSVNISNVGNATGKVLYAARSHRLSDGTNFFKGPIDPSTWASEAVPAAGSDFIDFDGLVDGGVYGVFFRYREDPTEDGENKLSQGVYELVTASVVAP